MNGFQAVMMTDTAPLRYRHYHSCDDTPDKLNFDWLVRVVAGLVLVVGDLVGRKNEKSSFTVTRPGFSASGERQTLPTPYQTVTSGSFPKEQRLVTLNRLIVFLTGSTFALSPRDLAFRAWGCRKEPFHFF